MKNFLIILSVAVVLVIMGVDAMVPGFFTGLNKRGRRRDGRTGRRSNRRRTIEP